MKTLIYKIWEETSPVPSFGIKHILPERNLNSSIILRRLLRHRLRARSRLCTGFRATFRRSKLRLMKAAGAELEVRRRGRRGRWRGGGLQALKGEGAGAGTDTDEGRKWWLAEESDLTGQGLVFLHVLAHVRLLLVLFFSRAPLDSREDMERCQVGRRGAEEQRNGAKTSDGEREWRRRNQGQNLRGNPTRERERERALWGGIIN